LDHHIFEDLVSRDNRYLASKEQWSKVLADLKQMALQKDAPAQIAQFLREKRAELLGT
jgi:exonuclease SbcD